MQVVYGSQFREMLASPQHKSQSAEQGVKAFSNLTQRLFFQTQPWLVSTTLNYSPLLTSSCIHVSPNLDLLSMYSMWWNPPHPSRPSYLAISSSKSSQPHEAVSAALVVHTEFYSDPYYTTYHTMLIFKSPCLEISRNMSKLFLKPLALHTAGHTVGE